MTVRARVGEKKSENVGFCDLSFREQLIVLP